MKPAGRLFLPIVCACAGLAAATARAQNAGAPVPVTVATAARADVPVYLRGIGLVQAQNAATIRARVDGTLMQVPVSEGQPVKQGELLAVIDPRPYQATLDQAMAKKSQDEATAANARTDLSRYSALAKSEFASRQQVDTQQATVTGSAAQLKADDAAIETAQLNLSYAFLTAPFDGIVGLRQIDPGNLIHATDATGIMTLIQRRPITVVFTLPQQELPAISAAMARPDKPIVIAQTGDDTTELDRGVLLTPDNMVDTATGTIKLKALFPNEHDTLWPGQFVNTRLLSDTLHGVVTIPSVAVQRGPDDMYAYVVKPDHTTARQPVEIGHDDRGVAVVTKGLDVGTTVVTGGASRLQAGVKVAIDDKGVADGGSTGAPESAAAASGSASGAAGGAAAPAKAGG